MPRQRAFTLIELLVVIAIVAILAAILFPVFAQAKQAAKKTQDMSNIRQIGMAIQMYAADHDDCSVVKDEDAGYDWFPSLFPYVKNAGVFRSPAYKALPDEPETDYLINGVFAHGTSLTAFSAPADQIVLALRTQPTEDTDYHPWPGDLASWDDPAAYVHPSENEDWFRERIFEEAFSKGSNYAFADGHAKFMRFEQTLVGFGYPGRHNVDRQIAVIED